MSSLNPAAAAIAQEIAKVLGGDVRAEDLKVDAPPRPELGDFAVGMFAPAKALKQAPPALAARVAGALAGSGIIRSATAAGPFVNVTVDRAAMFAQLARGELVPP